MCLLKSDILLPGGSHRKSILKKQQSCDSSPDLIPHSDQGDNDDHGGDGEDDDVDDHEGDGDDNDVDDLGGDSDDGEVDDHEGDGNEDSYDHVALRH